MPAAPAPIPCELYYIDSAKSMGKRELLLIAAFLVAGVIVYQVAAPPPRPDDRGISVSRIIEHMRRGVRGNRARAETTTTTVVPIDAGMTDIRLRLGSARVAVVGEDRANVAAELHVRSTGYDEAEAAQLANQTTLKIDNAGTMLIASIGYPEPGSQTATLMLKVPERLRVRVDGSGPFKASNVAEVELANARGDTTIERVRGRVSGMHRGGTVTLVQIGSLRFNGRNSDLRVTGVRDDLTVSLQAGQLRASDVAGPVEVDATQGEIMLEKLDKARGAMRINAVGGKVLIRGLRTETRINGRNTDIEIVIDQAAPLAVYNEADDIVVTPPPGGYRLDALARDGKITVPDALIDVTTEASDQRALGAINGGGATLTLRVSRGNIMLRARESSKADLER